MADTPNTAELGRPRRRWFQFRLRTLLIGVTPLAIPCAYVARQARIVAARNAWEIDHPSCRMFILLDEDGKPTPAVPLIRLWLGDEGVYELCPVPKKELQTARALFPEAQLSTSDANGPFD